MDLSNLSNVTLSAMAAAGFFVLTLIMAAMLSRHSTDMASDNKPSFWRRLLTGESLTETGLKFRIGVFIALMFTFMNIIGTAVIFLAEQAKI